MTKEFLEADNLLDSLGLEEPIESSLRRSSAAAAGKVQDWSPQFAFAAERLAE